jgi:YD repeat-containing protein
MGRMTSYDATGRQISTSNPAIQSAPLLLGSYKPDGHPASLTDANSHTISFACDGARPAHHRLASKRLTRTQTARSTAR